ARGGDYADVALRAAALRAVERDGVPVGRPFGLPVLPKAGRQPAHRAVRDGEDVERRLHLLADLERVGRVAHERDAAAVRGPVGVAHTEGPVGQTARLAPG